MIAADPLGQLVRAGAHGLALDRIVAHALAVGLAHDGEERRREAAHHAAERRIEADLHGGVIHHDHLVDAQRHVKRPARGNGAVQGILDILHGQLGAVLEGNVLGELDRVDQSVVADGDVIGQIRLIAAVAIGDGQAVIQRIGNGEGIHARRVHRIEADRLGAHRPDQRVAGRLGGHRAHRQHQNSGQCGKHLQQVLLHGCSPLAFEKNVHPLYVCFAKLSTSIFTIFTAYSQQSSRVKVQMLCKMHALIRSAAMLYARVFAYLHASADGSYTDCHAPALMPPASAARAWRQSARWWACPWPGRACCRRVRTRRAPRTRPSCSPPHGG